MNIISKRVYTYIFSFLTLFVGILSLAFFGLKLGIDFTGGSMSELSGVKDIERVKSIAHELKIENVATVKSGEDRYLVRMKEIPEDKHKEFKTKLEGVATEERFESVGATISKELIQKAFYTVGIAALAIIFYIAYAFRRIPKPVTSWQFGVSAVVAMLHDVLVVLGIFAFLGHYFGIEIDTFFVTAMLTVIGFSVHDTIVVFDRIREKLIKNGSHKFEETVNLSINETLVRSLATSFTVIMVLLVLYLFGGSSIKNFVLALLIGIAFGTYSSIFVASGLLVDWQKWRDKRIK